TSNICTSQTLCTLAATVFMSLLGKTGLRRIAEVNAARAHDARDRLVSEAKLEAVFSAPFFNEFVMRTRGADEMFKRWAANKIGAGVHLTRWHRGLTVCVLLGVTEMAERV